VTRLRPGERNIAMVFEDYALYPQMTVRKNVAFPLKVRGLSGRLAEERIDEVLQLLGLDALANRDVKGLSGRPEGPAPGRDQAAAEVAPSHLDPGHP
jgi:multiple sugar transport system ATP-binding protein